MLANDLLELVPIREIDGFLRRTPTKRRPHPEIRWK
jgi:hypothetical protein